MIADTGHATREDARERRPGSGRRAAGLGLRVVPASGCLVVSYGGTDAWLAALGRSLPAEPDRVAVMMAWADPAVMPRLAEQLTHWIPRRWESVRFVCSCAAAAGGRGRPAAQELSDLLGIEVLAPDGELVAVPGGALFVRGTPDGGGGRWWRLRPGRPPVAGDRRFPTPDWEYEMSAFVAGRAAGVDVEEIPAGLWLHRAADVHPMDLAFLLPVNPRTFTLVVSRPGDPPLPAIDVARVIGAMPEALRRRLVVSPYGDAPVERARLGDVAAAAANRTLRVRTGLPFHYDGLPNQVFAIGFDGRATWRPFAWEMAWRPHGGARIHRWNPPADHLLATDRALLRLTDRWVVEVVEAGLWIREHDRLDGAAAVRRLPLEAAFCTVVVGVVDDSPVQPPWRTIIRTLRSLPIDAQDRLRLAVPETAGAGIVRAAARACRRVAGVRRVCVLTAAGDLAPLRRAPRRDHLRVRPAPPPEPATASPEPGATAPAEPATAGTTPPVTGGDRARPPGCPPVVEVPDLVVNQRDDAAEQEE